MYSIVPTLLAVLGVVLVLTLSSLGNSLGLSHVAPAIMAVGLVNTRLSVSRGLVVVCMLTMTMVLGFVTAVQIIAYVEDLPFGFSKIPPFEEQPKHRSIVLLTSYEWFAGIRNGIILAGAGALTGVLNCFSGIVVGRLGNDLLIGMVRSPQSFNKVMGFLLSAAFLNVMGFVVAQVLLSQIN